jgi:threonine synthase
VVRDMEQFAATGALDLSPLSERVAADFVSRSVSEEETMAAIREFYTEYDYLLDPHTAVGVCAGKEYRDQDRPMVCLATAHPAKFGEAVTRAIGRAPELPPSLAVLREEDSRCQVLDADMEQIKAYVREHARS